MDFHRLLAALMAPLLKFNNLQKTHMITIATNRSIQLILRLFVLGMGDFLMLKSNGLEVYTTGEYLVTNRLLREEKLPMMYKQILPSYDKVPATLIGTLPIHCCPTV